MSKEQTQCPSCQKYNVMSMSPRAQVRRICLGITIAGCILTIIVVTAIIGVPMILIGILGLLGSFIAPTNKEMKCKDCGFKFLA